MRIVRIEQVEEKLIIFRDENVLLDSDVAEVYGVETRRINQAVKNNPDKLPYEYVIYLTIDEFRNLISKISTSNRGGRRHSPQVFTKRGLYILATIFKGDVATQTTLAIVDAFHKIRSLSTA